MAGVRGQGRQFDTQKALDNAIELFWRHGYEGVSISDLTRAIGITTSSLYAAFGGKRQLFDQVVERYLSTKGRFTSLALEEENDSISLIRRLFFEAANEYADASGPGGCLIVSAATCVTDANREVEEKLKNNRLSNIKKIESILQSDRNAGNIPNTVNPSTVAGFVATVLQGMAQRGRDGASSDDLRSTANLAFEQVERILGKP